MKNYWAQRLARDGVRDFHSESKRIIRWKEDSGLNFEAPCPLPDVEPAITPREAYSSSYWRYRAACVRSLASRHRGKTQDRLTGIAASYDLLAERARRVREQLDEIENS